MSLLSTHLEQINYSCQGIDALPFATPKIFTNALLSNHDITSLIRDTEAHERALFSVPPPNKASATSAAQAKADEEEAKKQGRRRQTVFNVAAGSVSTNPPTSRSAGAPRRQTAVAAVLGPAMHEQLRRGEADRRSDVDVEVLLRGAEKLCSVYEVPGVRERISVLRGKWKGLRGLADYYETKVGEQRQRLEDMDSRGYMDNDEDEDENMDGGDGEEVLTEADLRREEEEAREMETKKRELQGRLRQMERDLGGLMSM